MLSISQYSYNIVLCALVIPTTTKYIVNTKLIQSRMKAFYTADFGQWYKVTQQFI